MPQVRVGEIGLHYERSGRGPAVVFLNGLMMSARLWSPQVAALSDRFECVRYDLRGQLLSDKPPGDYSFDDHVGDLVGLLDVLGLERVHLIGLSFGGAVAVAFAAAHPARVRSLAVMASIAQSTRAHRHRFQDWMNVLDSAPRELFEHSLRQNYSDDYLRANQEVIRAAKVWFSGQSPAFYQGLRHLAPAIRDVDLLDRLGAIACPTLVLAAERDRLVEPESTAAIAAAIPGARLMRVDAGHALTLEQPERVNALLRGFLEEVEGVNEASARTASP